MDGSAGETMAVKNARRANRYRGSKPSRHAQDRPIRKGNRPVPPQKALDLATIARRAMREKGLSTDFPLAARQQAKRFRDLGADLDASGRLADLRGLPWTSIDNDDSLDLDQLEVLFLEGSAYRLLIAVADVDVYAGAHSPIDAAARVNTTSVYTGVMNFPMLPERLSFDLTSLLAGKSRRAMVVEMRISASGEINGRRIFPALVQNKAKLNYDAVAAWLDGKARAPEPLARDRELRLQVEAQDRLARILRRVRMAAGALEFATLDTRIEMAANGRVKRIVSRRQNRAERIIEELMVACNQSTAAFLAARNLPVFSRVVREPERWPRIVELAAAYHSRLPAAPDARALSGFLQGAPGQAGRLRRPLPGRDQADRSRRVPCPARRQDTRRPFRPGAEPLLPFHRPQPPLPRPGDPASAEGRAGRIGKKRLFPGEIAVPGRALHPAGGRGQQGGAPGEKMRGGRSPAGQARRPVFRFGHGQLGQGNLGAHQDPTGGRQAAARGAEAQGRRPLARPAAGHRRGKRLHRFCQHMSLAPRP
jgi:hypothetical protein